jgi:hypothetical protein
MAPKTKAPKKGPGRGRLGDPRKYPKPDQQPAPRKLKAKTDDDQALKEAMQSLRALKAVFNLAVKDGQLSRNPCAGMPKFPTMGLLEESATNGFRESGNP